MSDKRPDDIIFQATNNHGVSSGIPPYIDTRGKGKYYGYFENESREQFIFIYDYQLHKATLWVGDNGWDEPLILTDGQAPNVILSSTEQLWLQACWTAATAVEK